MNSKLKVKSKFADQDFKVGLVLLIVAILGYYYSVVYIYSVSTVGVAPDFYPKFLFFILGLSGIVLMIQGYKRVDKKPMPKYNWKMLIVTTALLFGYELLFEYFGFVISTIVFMVIFMLVLNERKPIKIVLVPILTTLSIYFLFTKAFMILLP